MKKKKKSVKFFETKIELKPVHPSAEQFEFYKDSKNEWRWRVVMRGEVISVSSEGYKRKAACIKGAKLTCEVLWQYFWVSSS